MEMTDTEMLDWQSLFVLSINRDDSNRVVILYRDGDGMKHATGDNLRDAIRAAVAEQEKGVW